MEKRAAPVEKMKGILKRPTEVLSDIPKAYRVATAIVANLLVFVLAYIGMRIICGRLSVKNKPMPTST
jgi:hypothetical protein